MGPAPRPRPLPLEALSQLQNVRLSAQFVRSVRKQPTVSRERLGSVMQKVTKTVFDQKNLAFGLLGPETQDCSQSTELLKGGVRKHHVARHLALPESQDSGSCYAREGLSLQAECLVFPGPGETEGGLVGQTGLTTTTTEKPPRKVYPERKARVRGHRPGKVRLPKNQTPLARVPLCASASSSV